MSPRQSAPVTWRPKGCSDALDSSDAFKGAMASMQNLLPDPTTDNVWYCRPASIRKTAFATFNTPGFISALKIIGDVAYGMIATARNAGNDEPFAYDLAANLFIAVGNVLAANTPASPSSSGAWTPPTMAYVGSKLIVTHPGFAAGANMFGWFDLSNPAVPVWNAGNMTGAINFTTVPTAVAQFNGRAYFIHNVIGSPAVVFSDVLNGTNATNANQVLTFGDAQMLTALAGLPLSNQLGGIIQSLMVFKGVTNIYQITGDAALNTLSVNTLNVSTGTLAPLSIATTPLGLAIVSPDGLRIIDFEARISNSIGHAGQGVATPFIYAATISRVSAACNGDFLRISTQNNNAPGAPNQEWWYDFSRQIWHGPHTFPASLIQPWRGTFVMAPIGVTGSLWQSDTYQSASSTFVENGAQMTFNYSTCMLPDTDSMMMNAIRQGLIDIAFAAGLPAFTASLVTQDGITLNSVSIAPTGTATQWGGFSWGGAVWGGAAYALAPRQLDWTRPVVFARIQFQLVGQCATNVKLGTLHLRYQELKYRVNLAAVA